MSTLTLPGTISGLLRRGSPVLAPVSLRVRAVGRRALVEGEHLDTGMVALADGAMEAPADVHLDLTDATGRAHAAWWLAGEVGAAWVLSCDGFRRWELHGGERPRHSLSRAWQGTGAEMRRMGLASSDWVDCPALDALDPDDPRLLPDGSRWVDAEALRRVVLHVAGVAS